MLNKLQGRINGESFREVNRRRHSRKLSPFIRSLLDWYDDGCELK